MAVHPELASEQLYVDRAYACLDAMRASARQLRTLIAPDPGGTFQARLEREINVEHADERLHHLEVGREPLVFGRVDQDRVDNSNGARYYIGRIAVSDTDQEPVVVDWRAPVAEPFYRATGRNSMGIARRRHFAAEGRTLLGIDDEVFDLELLEQAEDDLGLVGTGALLAALGKARQGHMRDVVATIQAEQDQIIRAPLGGVLVVQGGPGTGKTAVALHRAAYLLYTHRFPLERQGVLVVGPNRLFMRYISRVLPALGETGVELAAIDDLFPEAVVTGRDSFETSRVKGDPRMAKVLRRAVATRQRHLRGGLTIPYGVTTLKLRAGDLADLITQVKRMHRLHNPSRRHLVQFLAERLHRRYQEALGVLGRPLETGGVDLESFTAAVRRDETFKLAVDRMWPLLTPQMLLRDLFGAPALIRAASSGVLNEAEQRALYRDRGESLEAVAWTSADIALVDEAATLLGPIEKNLPGAQAPNGMHWHAHGASGQQAPVPALTPEEAHRTYGHIVVDEAQDFSPMQLRMLKRRSLSGSMTVVGDIAQATGMFAPKSWDDVVAHLPDRRAPQKVELSVGYRTPGEIMALAARVLEAAAPELRVPTSVRTSGQEPAFIPGRPGEDLVAPVARAIEGVSRAAADGTIGVICPDSLAAAVVASLLARGVTVDSGAAAGADGVAVIGVSEVKGLEFDGVVVVEPARIVREAAQGLRALYVALTRATRALAVVHLEPLPDILSAGD